MMLAPKTSFLGFAGLALTMLSPAALAQQTKAVEALPWQKPAAPQADPDVKEILPWLLGTANNKSAKARPVWNATVGEPQGPSEPNVADPEMAPGTAIETGAIQPSGLVLKPNVAAALPAAAGPAKIKRSVALPGDQPVEQSDANAVSADQSGVAQQSEAEAAPAVPPEAASPVEAQQRLEANVEPVAAGEAQAAVPDANAVAPNLQAATSPEASSAPPVEQLPAPASPVRPAFPRAKAVEAAPGAVGAARPKPNAAAAVEGGEQTLAQAVQAPAATVPSAPTAEAAAQAPEAAQPVEASPALPVAEEAPAIPDPLPEAVVTPVPNQSNVTATEASPAAPPVTPATAVTSDGTKPPLPRTLVDNANVAQQYCFNIADAAKDARYAWQKKTLADIETELNKRIALLDARTAEYQKWLARRDEFIRNAEENVVKIMSGMRPDAAAVQLSLMNEESAAAVIAKLNTRNASAVMNEMSPEKAAKLTMIITGAAKLKRKKELQQQLAPGAAPGTAPVRAGAADAAGTGTAQPQGGRS